jgi:hypothetical protein
MLNAVLETVWLEYITQTKLLHGPNVSTRGLTHSDIEKLLCGTEFNQSRFQSQQPLDLT